MKFKRIMATVLMAVMLLGIIPFGAQAADWGEGDTLDDALSELKVGFDNTLLDWLVLPNLGTIYLRYTYFQFKNEITGEIDEHPVYCIDPSKGGAKEIVAAIGPNNDGSQTATYIRGDKVGDARYMSIMYNGYPHMRLGGLGLETKEEGYYATKLALWMYIRGNNPDKLTINPKYGNSDSVALRVRDAAVSIYNKGTKNSSPAREPKLTLTGKPSATANLDAAGEYYVQGVEVYASGYVGTNPDACGDVQLSWDSPPPAGTIVLGTDGEDITSSLAVKVANTDGTGYFGKVTIKYPASDIDVTTFSPPTLKAEAIVPNNGLYVAYAEAGKTKYQRYLVESNPKIVLPASFVSQLSTTTITDFPTDSGLRIRKVQAGTNTPLGGAVFEIRDPDGKLIYSMATDASGIIDIPLSVTGNYTVTEVTPPEFHLLSENRTQSVTVSYGAVAEVTFANAPYGTLRVVKRDASNGNPLGGAAIRIKNITTNTTQEMFTDSSGCAVFEKLPVGAYEIVEITSPDGYELDSTPHTVNVVPLSEGETSYTLTNKALPGLRITKFDRQTMTPIEGVTFEIWRDGELVGTYTTDAWGEIELRDIPAGTYTAREVATVSPYVLDPTAQWIEIHAGQGYISDLYFFNLVKPGISLVKIDSVTYEPLAGARFRISKVGDTFSKEYETDENGEVNLSELDPGAYQVEELAAPNGWLIDDAIRTIQINAGESAQFIFTNTKKPILEVIKFDGENYVPGATFRIAKIADGSNYLDRITDINGKIRIEDLEPGIYSVRELAAPPDYILNETEFHVELFPGRTSQLVVNNVRKPDLCIVKTDANTGQPMEGVTFTVRKVDSSTLETVSTDANGEAWMYRLDEGVYEITEQSVPPTHLLDTNKQLITLVGGRTGVVRFQNYPRPKLEILKVDAVTGERLPNAEFRVSKVEGGTVSEYITDETGRILIENLDVAIYKAEEFMPPDGYLRYDESKQIQLEPGKTSTLKFDNIRKPVLVFLKTNGLTGEPVVGATYKVEYEMPGGGVKNLGSFKTGADGRIVIPKAEPGWYILTETVPAPGFSLPSNPVTRMYIEAGQNAYLAEFAHHYSSANDSAPVGLLDFSLEGEVHSGSEYIVQGEDFNWPLNSIVIKKTHAITGELLPGAAFELYRADEHVSGVPGTCIGRYTTDNSGVVVITGLEAGYYVVKEVQAPQNFLISENSQQNGVLKVDGTSVLEFTFANYPYGSLLISKVDALTGEPLAGAKFKVTDSTGAVIGNSNGEYVTDSRGEILISNIKPGAVVVTEIQAPENYAIITTPQTVQIGTDGKTYKVTFDNYPYGAIIINKYDSVTREPLEGAEFKVTDSTGAVVGTGNGIFRTNANGTVTIPNLSKGSYVISEVKAPDGFLLENNTQTVSVDYGKTYTIDVYNKKLSGLQIIKIDAESKQPLKGARFTIYRMDGGVVGTYETNGDGVIILDALNSGWYKAVESKAPDGYLIDDTPQDFQITANQFIKLTFENKRLASIQIKKIDELTGAPLAGAVFEVRQQNGAFVGEFTTDQSGGISIPAVAPGWFIIKELRAPSGYILNETAKTVEVKATVPTVVTFTNRPIGGLIIVKLDEDTRNSLQGAVFEVRKMSGEIIGQYTTDDSGIISLPELESGWYSAVELKAPSGFRLDSEPRNIEVKDGQTAVLEVTNQKQASLIIRKLNSVTDEPLQGAVFSVTDSNGAPIGPENGRYTTDKYGQITITQQLIPGAVLTVRELSAPDGFIMDADPQTLTVKADTTHTLTFLNTLMSGLVIKKMDSVTKAPLSGVTFKVTSSNGSVVGTANGEYVTDATGVVNITGLKPDTYVVQELKAKNGYLLDTTAKTIEIRDAKAYSLEFYNQPLSGLQINKFDSVTKKPLSGAVFKVTDSRGQVVGTANGEFTTDNNGMILITGLEPSAYTATEIRCPSGYIMDSSPKTIEVVDGRLYTLEFTNTPIGEFQLLKLDEETRKAIPGVEFVISKMNGERVGTYTTDSNGLIRIPSLEKGWYSAVETKAASGYSLDSSAHSFEMKDGQTTAITVTNRKDSAILIRKIDSVTGKGIYGVKFLISDANNNPIRTETTDQNGYIFTNGLPDGKYYIREIEAAKGYLIDNETKTFYVLYGSTTEITWKNTPTMGQIQITKRSADDNPINGFPKGTLLQGAVFEIYDRANNLVDTVTSDKNGLAVSKTLPIGRYSIREAKAPAYYSASQEAISAEIEFSGQIVRLEVLNSSVYTNVSITKRGYAEVVPGQQIRYDFKNIGNNSTVALDSFYWRDTLPTDAVRLNKIVTGTWTHQLSYKIVYKTNVKSDYRTLADNLSSSKVYTLDASPAALGLASNEYVTEFMVVFGRVPAGFKQVDAPYIYCDVLKGLAHEYRFTNKCDAGGLWGSQWIMANDRWVTVVFSQAAPPKLPRTGY